MRGRHAAPLLALALACAPSPPAPPESDTYEIVELQRVEDFDAELAVLETVFWEPRDTISLRRLIREEGILEGKTVLEIGTGTGLLSLCALEYGAERVIATDVNPAAVANARHNADQLGLGERLEVRRVPLDDTAAFTVMRPGETFDVIVSNPPWADDVPREIAEYALYDEGFRLMRSLLEGLPERLNPGGRALLAYGNVSGIRALFGMSEEMGYSIRVLEDDRDLDELPEAFLPGMLLEVKPTAP